MFANTATLCHADTSGQFFLRRRLPSHDLPCSDLSDRVAICAPRTQEQRKNLPHRHIFISTDDVPEMMDDFYTSGLYARDSRAMHVVSLSDCSRSACSAGPHFSVGVDVGSIADDVVEVSIDNYVTESKVAACPFDPQFYKPEEV